MEHKKIAYIITIFSIITIIVTGCNNKNLKIEASLEESINKENTNSQYIDYSSNEKKSNFNISTEKVLDFAWQIYYDLGRLKNSPDNSTLQYDEFCKKYFIDLTPDYGGKGFYPFYEDILYKNMNYEHIMRLNEEILAKRFYNNRQHYLVRLSSMAYVNYEMSIKDEVKNNISYKPFTIYMMLAVNDSLELAFYNILMFISEEPTFEDNIKAMKMFNGIIEHQDEKVYLTDNIGKNINNFQQQPDEIINKVVTVCASSEDGYKQGSGTYISQYQILTNYDLVKDSKEICIYTAEGDRYFVDGMIDYSEELNVSLLKLEKDLPKHISSFNIASGEDLTLLNDVYYIGNKNGLKISISDGFIDNFWNYNDIKLMQISADINDNNSGGALVNENGELLGIGSNININNEENLVLNNINLKQFEQYYNLKGNVQLIKNYQDDGIDDNIYNVRKIRDVYMIYSREKIEYNFDTNITDNDTISSVLDSVKNKNEWISGYYQYNNYEELDNEVRYLSNEIDEKEKSELLKLKDYYSKANIKSNDYVNYIEYSDVNILGEANVENKKYVLIEGTMNVFDLNKELDGIISRKKIYELYVYDEQFSNYKYVGIVNFEL